MTTTEPDTGGKCLRCGKEIAEGGSYCASCVVRMADEDIAESSPQDQAHSSPRERTRRRWWIRGLLVAASLTVIFFQAPRVAESLRKPPPIRSGVQDTDRVTDQCIRNLWTISRIIQEGGNPDRGLKCPACRKPYDIIVVNGETLVRCPDPAAHGLRELRVSSQSPCPEVN